MIVESFVNNSYNNLRKANYIIIIKILMLIITFGIMSHAMKYQQYMRGLDDLCTLLCDGSAITGNRAKEIQDYNSELENQKAFVIWGSLGNAVVTNSDLNRSKDVEILVMNGRTDLVFSNSPWLDRGDYNQCLIDENTAMELYGSKKVSEVELIYNNKAYQVKGVLENAKDTLIVQSDSSEVIGLEKITIRTDAKTSEKEIQRKMETQYGITGTILRYSLLTESIELVSLLFPIIIGCHLMTELIKNVRNASNKKKEYFFWSAGLLVFMIVFIILIFKRVSIPEDYIPTRWSDFSFWSSFFSEQFSTLIIMFKMSKSSSELYYCFVWLKTISLLCLCNIMYIVGIRKCALKGNLK
ncbi:hypothetical protein M2454_001185 [Aequitasia blattaphilus]|uniref:MacB-like periplasmic core domain-containing protein n=1 Tax=Aequitasia blattaphilus TaxID=2949332 RepID=A0ABT1E6H8_9FIRM|nr:hypothetical protein [Aequitasia blattaphilus]MCP1101449.1 hypothetical protein [Aequitasia blattaphilus]MCR8614089.1 hypothetical protein [Aequitasia blattaphilus]